MNQEEIQNKIDKMALLDIAKWQVELITKMNTSPLIAERIEARNIHIMVNNAIDEMGKRQGIFDL